MDFIEFFKVGLLAVFQGIAEFLPISSSGHLQVLGALMGIDPESNKLLTVILHGGTLLAILLFYVREIWMILAQRQYRLMLAVIVGSVPAGIVGIALKLSGWEDVLFGGLWVPAIGFAVTAALLFFAMKGRSDADDAVNPPIERIGMLQALAIGVAQAVAITPGISRSGSTIAAGLKMGLRKTDCAEFSFLLAIPAIAGAMLLELKGLFDGGMNEPASQLAAWGMGFVLAAAVGYFSLKLLVNMLKRGRLSYFAWYLVLASAATFALAIFRR